MKKRPQWEFPSISWTVVLLIIILSGLCLTSLYSYLLFHSLAEIVSIIIAASVFLLVWYARRYFQNDYLQFLGIASLFVAGLDTLHTLAFKGMGVFQGYDANLPTQLWIAARYLQSLSLLVAAVFFRRTLNSHLAFAGFAAVTAVLLGAIFSWHVFPACYVEGVGLTTFKIASEYAISLILLASIVPLYLNRRRFDPVVFLLLVLSIAATIGAELAFTSYIGVYDLANLVGHLLKICAYFLLAHAILVIGLTRPYDLLFRELEQEKDALQTARNNLELRVHERTYELAIANEQIEQQLDRLKSLRAIDLAILGASDSRLALRTVMEEAIGRLQADAIAILLFNRETLMLEVAANMGFRSRTVEPYLRTHLGEGIAGKAALEQRSIAVARLAREALPERIRSFASTEEIQALYVAPLIAKGELLGVLEIVFRRPFAAGQDWLNFFEAIAGQAAMAIDSSISFENLQRAHSDLALAYDTTIEGWSHALDLRDRETEGHTRRVTEMTVKLARTAGMSENELVHVRRGALLHDIGKMGVPDHILLKPDALTEQEWKTMRRHPDFANELLSSIDYLHPALDIPYCHHEKWDGTGYPRGLKGEQIPMTVRLFAVVDVWDALRSDRPYRKAWSEERVREHTRSLAGTHFDPKAVELFLDTDVPASCRHVVQ